MRYWALFILCQITIMTLFTVQAKTIVRVGGYEFPPYIELHQGVANGFTIDLIQQLNQSQSDYHFEFVLTTPNRRYQDYQHQLFDAILFEDVDWGWRQREIAIDHSTAFAKDDEIFIALKSATEHQSWFDDLADKTIAGILGFHYKLANYHTDPSLLAEYYNMLLLNNHRVSIELVLKQRADMAVVTRSFLYHYLKEHPGIKQQLIISERVDQTYKHQLLIHPDHALTMQQFYQLVHKTLSDSNLSVQWQQSGLVLLDRQNN